MIQDILNTINQFRRGKMTDEEFKRFDELMYIRKLIGKDVYDKCKKEYEGMVETIKFSYDGPCYVEIKRADDEAIVLCLYKSFMYGEAPYYEGYDRAVKLDITSNLFKSILECVSEDCRENKNKMSLFTFDVITKMLKDTDYYPYIWSIPLRI